MQRFGSVYKITHRDSGKGYVGQTTSSVDVRWIQHKSLAKRPDKLDTPLMRAIRKYGPDAFDVVEIAVAFDREGLDYTEDQCIEAFGCLVPEGYNLMLGSGGHNHHESTKEKIRAHRHTAETRQRMSAAHKKRYQDPAERAKQGRVQSKAERRKRSETMKRLGHKPPSDPASIAKMAAAKRGKPSGKAKPIIDQFGTVYRSMEEAARECSVSVSGVSQVVNGKRKTVKGYVFSYLSTNPSKETA